MPDNNNNQDPQSGQISPPDNNFNPGNRIPGLPPQGPTSNFPGIAPSPSPGMTGLNTTTTGNTGPNNMPAPFTGNLATIPSGAQDLFRYLTQAALSRNPALPPGMNLQDPYNQFGGLFNNLLSQTGQYGTQRDNLINLMLSGQSPGGNNLLNTIGGFYDRANLREGLTPEAMTALRQESTSGLQDRYNNASSNLMTGLLQRGFAGQGSMPGNPGQFLNAFGPLQSQLAQAQSGAGRQATLADQQQQLQSLLANRGLAAQSVGMGSNLLGQFGNIYNPLPWANAAQGALQGQLSTAGTQLGAYNAQTGAFGPALQAAGGLGNLQPTSFRNILLSSLLGAGTGYLTRGSGPGGQGPSGLDQIIKAIGSIFGGGGGGGNGGGGGQIGVQYPGPDDQSGAIYNFGGRLGGGQYDLGSMLGGGGYGNIINSLFGSGGFGGAGPYGIGGNDAFANQQ